MTFIWLIVWLDYGLPQLHHSWWTVFLIGALTFDIIFKLASEE